MKTVISERDLHLLPRDALVKTNELDQADWNFRPLLGWVQRLRMRCVASVLASSPRAERLLEVGYGSGVFVPELARHADNVFGADVRVEPPIRFTLVRQRIFPPVRVWLEYSHASMPHTEYGKRQREWKAALSPRAQAVH